MNETTSPESFDWMLVRSFLAVLDTGSLSGAARQIGSSQPTIGRHVAELERQLRATLFERNGRGLAPTAAALSIADQARCMDDSAQSIARRLSGLGSELGGSVRVSASQVVAAQLLPGVLVDMRRQLPGVTVDIVASNHISNLLRREADIAIRMVRPQQASLIARRIGTVGIGVYASADYLRRRPVPRTAQDLLHHDLIGFDQDDQIVRGLQGVGVAVTRDAFRVRSDDHLVHWQCLLAGLGIGFAATWLADREPGLRRILPELPIPALPVWLAVHREIRSNLRVRAVFDFLAAAVPQVL
ncbi:LysR family transcriptional regulator [Thiomonas intermedia]|uniref:LysR family transcriptional regulator n=1 Tax=Thiomonas intermedia TaxID=926 RepID=UPI0009A4DBB6|nr:LysR family transcriptional regulator [Thiomonas intermedia]